MRSVRVLGGLCVQAGLQHTLYRAQAFLQEQKGTWGDAIAARHQVAADHKNAARISDCRELQQLCTLQLPATASLVGLKQHAAGILSVRQRRDK